MGYEQQPAGGEVISQMAVWRKGVTASGRAQLEGMGVQGGEEAEAGQSRDPVV